MAPAWKVWEKSHGNPAKTVTMHNILGSVFDVLFTDTTNHMRSHSS
jgi:hypothetical protein